MYSSCFFFFVFFFFTMCQFSQGFLKCLHIGFLLSSKDAFHVISFFLIAINTHGNLYLALGLIGMHSAVAPI